MEKTKEEIIAELYALRGGLSLISTYTDEIRACDTTIENKQKELEKINRNCREIQEYLKLKQREKINHENAQRLREDRIKNERNFKRAQAQNHAEGARISFKKSKLKAGILGGITAVFALTCIILFLLGIVLDNGKYVAAGAVLIEFFIVFLIVFIKFFKKSKSAKRYFERINVELERANALCKSDIDAGYDQEYYMIKNDIKNNQVRLNDERKQAEICTKLIEENRMKKAGSLPTISIDCQNVKKALNATYDNWLAESDWQNVDLLIYYLETGRADTLKEALTMVDRQLQTNQIANAISMASTAICNKIDSSMSNLSRALSASFSVISNQLSGISGKLDRVIDISEKNAEKYRGLQNANINAIKEMGSEIRELKSAQFTADEMNRALLEKSNRTSEQLMNDLRYGQQFWIK